MSTNAKLRFGLWYDFRNPPAWKRPYDQLYGEIFDQIVWGEQHGFADIWLSEHHFIEDGYSPALLPIAAAIAARTKTIRIGTSVMLLPFHHPVRLAEDAATVDVISGGRFELGVGTGYKVEEFSGFALSSTERGGRTNEGLEIIRRLWEGETLTFKGRYYAVNNVKLTPEPMSFSTCGVLFKTRTQSAEICLLLLPCLLLCTVAVPPVWGASENGAAPRTWKTVSEMSPAELAQVDPRTDTPRHAEYPYLPAEPYPFTPPYTAEEMGYRMMEFIAVFSCMCPHPVGVPRAACCPCIAAALADKPPVAPMFPPRKDALN